MKRSISEQNKTQKTLQICLMYSICFTYSMNDVLKVRIFFPLVSQSFVTYEGWNFNSGNYLFTTDTK